MIGRTISHYGILEKLGGGGMEHDPFIAGLRGDERFDALLAWLEREWQDVAV